MLLGHEKVSFLHLPTPLEYLPGVSQDLGVEFYIKRDDLTNLGVGGNKLRKLEYLLKDAQDQGCTMLLTLGGAQTNHGRLTAAVAAKYGLKCAIVMIDEYPGEVSANILLDRIMGCDLIMKADDGTDEHEQFDKLCAQVIAEYEAKGEKVYYIPMGGSRKGKLRKWLNVLITFLVSGLWHGANWSYVLWGGLNGVMQVIGEWKNLLLAKGKGFLTQKGWKEPESARSFSARLLKTLITFCLICITWVFFRAESAQQGFQILRQMFLRWNPWILFDDTLISIGLGQTDLFWLLASIGVLFCVDLLHEKGCHLRDSLLRQQFWFRLLIYMLGIFSILLLGVYGPNMDASAFIYFQF